MRYVVTEIEGFLSIEGGQGSKGNPGLSCHVIDTLVNHRVVGTFRTEDGDRSAPQFVKRMRVRGAAAELAARLNGETARSEAA